jgi:hypothetical protein
MPSAADIELAFYERFLIEKGIEPYPAQEQAFARIFAGDSVLVTVPTGTGKTLMAKAALFRALQLGQRAVYTTPLRALTEEKFRELEEDFGLDAVGFATGDYRVRPEAPLQVVVAEILWNRIYGGRGQAPADVVIMDEGHYFNDPERGYVWEQSIIGLDPRVQLVILSATIGDAEAFCQWAYLCRRAPLELVQSFDRKVPLYHQYRESYLVEVAKELHAAGDVPAIIFGFSREQCFERARLLRACPRFTTDDERLRIAELCDGVVLERGLGPELRPLLLHGIGVHHAGVLPRYKALVEKLALERLVKFVVSTETISAGINLPAKRVIFPSLRKHVAGKARLLTSAEYHQMAGRAGRPQFDTEGIAITLAPEEVVQETRKELKDAKKGGFTVDEEKLRRGAYARARAQAVKDGDVTWDPQIHEKLVGGRPAPLRSQTKITPQQILAIGLPDLAVTQLPGAAAGAEPAPAPTTEGLPAAMNLNIVTVIDHLLLGTKDRAAAHRALALATDNLRALEIVDEHGAQVKGEIVGKLHGLDGLFVYYALMSRDLVYEEMRELVELLVEHDAVWKILSRKLDAGRREAILGIWRERRREEPQLTFEDIEAEYDVAHPRELSPMEQLHAEFLALLPHPELHGGKKQKKIWCQIEDEQLSFMDFVDKHELANEEGSLFSYLARVGKTGRMLFEVTGLEQFQALQAAVRTTLAEVDERVLEELA